MTLQELYQSKKGSLEDALSYIRSNDDVCLAGDCNEPVAFARNLHKIAPRVENVTVIKARTGNFEFVKGDNMNGHINTGGFFFGPGWGEGQQKLNTSMIVTDLPSFGRFVSEHRPPNVFVAQVTPMDENGKFQIGLCMMWEPETFEAVMKQPNHRIILEVNPQQVRVKGGLEIDINDVTCLYEVDEPLMEIPSMQTSEVEETIGGLVSELVHDGDTIQLGIGSLPDAVAHHLMDKRDLGLHTEMITTSMGEMIRRGIITGERKNYYKGVHVCSFAGGDRALYETMRDTPNLRIVPGSYGVDPMTIMQNDNMVSINTILEMDLTGQVCSEVHRPPAALRFRRRLLLRLWRAALQGRPGHPGLCLPEQEGYAQDQAHPDPRRCGHHPPELCGLHRHRVRRGPPAGLQRQGALRAADLHRPSRRPG